MTQQAPFPTHETTPRTSIRWWRTLAAGILLLSGVIAAHAQVAPNGQKQMGEPADDKLPTVLHGVTIAQHLNEQLPLDSTFVDETGKAVKLGQYFDGKHPVLLALVYYKCPILCSEELKGLTGALEMVSYRPGKDFQIVAISIDPTETPAIAASKKREYVTYYGHPESASGWHFLTGKKDQIDLVAQAVGFRYVWDPEVQQYAHASGIMLLTPQGRVAQYYYGIEYAPRDIQLGLVEASQGKIGNVVDQVLLYCFHYDPRQGRYGPVIFNILRLSALVTVLLLGGFMLFMFRRDALAARRGRLTRTAT